MSSSYKKRFLAGVVLLIFSASFPVFSQSIIKGKIFDQEASNGISMGNIYLGGTEKGTVSQLDGSFELKTDLTGKFDLIFSYTGFVRIKVPVIIRPDSTYEFNIGMMRESSMLSPLYVRRNRAPNAASYRQFKRLFLGETRNAQWCSITNPQVIELARHDGVLRASAREPIVIVNEALGYRISYYLDKFEAANNVVAFTGVPLFEELKPRSEKQKVEWANAREKAYRGSLNHFMRSVVSNRLQNEGWEVRLGYTTPRAPELVALAKLMNFKRLQVYDSAKYYKRMLVMPPDPSKWSRLIDGWELLSLKDDHKIDYRGTILITYKNENDESYSVRKIARFQQSRLTLSGDFIKVYSNGYFEPQQNIFRSGYLSWSANVAEFVPYDYIPASN